MTKKWHRSKTIWVNVIAVCGLVLARVTGVSLSVEETTGLLAVINLALRIRTDTGLSA